MRNSKRKNKISDEAPKIPKLLRRSSKPEQQTEKMTSAEEEQSKVGLFMEIAAGQSDEIARRFLQATNWNLEEAVQLFYVGNEGREEPSPRVVDDGQNVTEPSVSESAAVYDEDEVRAPMPVIRDVLYDDVAIYGAGSPMARLPVRESGSVIAFRNFQEELKQPGVWESNEGATSTRDSPRDNLASLYRPPFKLLFHGSFEKAKGAASVQDKWLLVNLQSNTEFSSHMLNRDTWANEAVSQTILTNFIFWQTYDDTTEGKKVCTYYKLESAPVVLIIDPITGEKMRLWNGMVQPERLLEDLLPFMDSGPRDHHLALSNKRPRESSMSRSQNKNVVAEQTNEDDEELQRALAASMGSLKDASGSTSKDEEESITDKEEEPSLPKMPTYPPLPEEPTGDKSLICKVAIRLPDGCRTQRNFLRADPIQLLWSFCYSKLDEAETRPIRLTHAVPGAVKVLNYDSESTFEEAGLPSSMVSVTWE